MNKYIKVALINICIIGLSVSLVNGISWFSKKEAAAKGATIGQLAPDFKGTDSNGNTQKLSDYRGKIVVLEWKNHGCPFVKKFYSQGAMQSFQKKYTDQDVIWLSIVSSAKGKQGNQTPEECNDLIKREGSQATAVIQDESGDIGRLYEAKTTPHMFVVNPKGILVYKGAIDSIRSASPNDVSEASNYVIEAIEALKAGKDIAVSSTQPYGCSVKY